mgnify:CR=1 FL=1
MSSQTTTHAAKAPAKGAAKASSGTYISLMALVMMNVTIIGSVANDVQQAYYGLSSVTLFIIGALVFFLPTGLVAAELASGWGQRGGIFRWVGEAMALAGIYVPAHPVVPDLHQLRYGRCLGIGHHRLLHA